MAEFKLGRIRFVWKGAWYTGTIYSVDDVVRYGGRTYICVVNHTANAEFQVDFDSGKLGVDVRWSRMERRLES